jgi:hypothetical protein
MALPRSILAAGASFLSARAATKLVAQQDAGPPQRQVFKDLIPRLAEGFVWAQAGIEAGMAYEAFRARVPLQTAADLGGHIDSMRLGAEDVLWPGGCPAFAVTAGTTGPAQALPLTKAMQAHFRRGAVDAMLWYSARARNTRLYRGRHLLLGGSTAMLPAEGGAGLAEGNLAAVAALELPGWFEKHLYEPGAAVADLPDGPERMAAVAERTLPLDLTLVSGLPNWLLEQARALLDHAAQAGHPAGTLQELWPRLECLVHRGLPLSPFYDELRDLAGPTVAFHEVYSAAEGFIAAQDADAAAGLRLMADAGIFFEFLPMAEYDRSRLHLLGPKALPVSGVKAGVDYALVLTTPAGLARYVNGDVVRFTTTAPARLQYVGRTEQRLNAFGENVIEKELTDCLVSLCRRNNWTIVNFHVAPFFTASTTGNAPGRHEWWVELHAGTAITPTGPIMAGVLDMELMRNNPLYNSRRTTGSMDAPYVRLVMPGVFRQWMTHHGKWGGENKMPRCQGDRAIADELGGALQFAKD